MFSVSMESLSPQVVSAAKLPIVNSNEFDLWKVRIEQYFLMTDYSLWEVILNGDSPLLTRVIEGVVQPLAPTPAKQRLARKNELKAREWRTHTLIWRNKTDLEDQILDDLFNSLKIYKAEVKSSSSARPTTQNIAFVSSQNTDSTNESVSTVATVCAASAKVPVSALPNVDTLSDDVIYSFFPNGHVDYESKEIFLEDWRGHFARECKSPKDTRRNVPVEPQRRNILVETSTSNALVSQCDGVGSYDWSFQTEEEPTNYALMAFTSSSSSTLRMKFKKAEQERDELKLKLEKFQTSSKNLSQLLASQTNDKTGLGYDNQVFTSSMFDCDAMLVLSLMLLAPLIEDWISKSEDDYEGEPIRTQINPSFVHPTEQVKTPRPSVEHPIPAATLKTEIPKSRDHENSKNRKACFACKSLTHLIKDLLTRSKLVPLIAARPVTIAVPHNNVARPRQAKTIVTKPHSPPRRTINHSSSPKPSTFPPKVTTIKAPKGNPQHTLKDKGVIDGGCSRHMRGNMSYLSDFEAINRGYVAFGGNPKGGKITGKGKIRTCKLDFNDIYFVKELKFNLFSVSQMCDKKNSVLFTNTECIVLSFDFKLPDDNHVLLRVPRENNMYNVDLKNIVPSGDLTFLFSKVTLDESTIWHRRLGHINIKTMNKLVKGNLIRGLPSKVFENNHTCVACKKGKQHRASCKTKPVSSVSQPLQRKNRTLIEAARTMLADSLLPIPFWAEAVNTACYVQNRVLVTKPHNKTPYELLLVRTPSIRFMRPFGCPVTILNILDPLENKPNDAGSGPTWLFDIDTLTKSMNYQPVTTGNQPNPTADPQNTTDDATFEVKELEFEVEKPESEVHVSPNSSAKTKKYDDKTTKEAKGKSPVELSTGFRNLSEEFEDFFDNSINEVNAASTPVPAVRIISTNSTNTFSAAGPSNTAISPTLRESSYVDPSQYPDDLNMLALEDITYSDDEEDVGAEADFTNSETTITVSPILTTRVHKDHPVTQIISDLSSATQTRSMTRMVKDQGGLTQINNEDFHTCMFACFLSKEEPKRYTKLLKIQCNTPKNTSRSGILYGGVTS
nr:ribonuclease H-like domain-containing protein [Tanacetum cinerariifolium]